jgi:hypothetical protein
MMCNTKIGGYDMYSEILFSDLPARIAEGFADLDSAIVDALPDNDEEYAGLVKQQKELTARFPKLESWLEGNGPLPLSAEEHAGLVEYLELATQMESIERLAIYYAGHKDCIAYLKKIGAI